VASESQNIHFKVILSFRMRHEEESRFEISQSLKKAHFEMTSRPLKVYRK